MPNTFLTPTVVANEALFLLMNNMVAARLFDRGWQPEFSGGEKKGDTVKIRRRDEGTVQEFSSNITVDDVDETSVNLTLEKHFDTSTEVTSKDLTLNIQQFSKQILEPRMLRLAEKVDAYCLSKFAHIPTVAGASASAPAALPTTIGGIAQDDETLNNQKVPTRGRIKIISSELKRVYLSIGEFVSAEKRGNSEALRTASIGEVMGFDHYMDQNVDTTTFTSGTMTSLVVNGALAAGATSIVYDGASGAAHTLKAGDILTIAGYGNVVVAADATAVSSAGTVTIRDPLRVAVADDTAITVYDGGGNTRAIHGAAFHPSAFAFVSAPLALPDGAAFKAMAQDPFTGISVRMVKGYSIATKKETMSLDVLVGAALVEPRLAAQIVKNI